jgi:hypothetical protein
MPCQSDYLDEDPRGRKEIDKLTRLLCTCCQFMERINRVPNIEVWEWWEQHKKADEARRLSELKDAKRERLRQQALNRLTPDEREALGL